MASSAKSKVKRKKSKKKRAAKKWTDSTLLGSEVADDSPKSEDEFREWAKYLKSRKRKSKTEKVLKGPVLHALGWLVSAEVRSTLAFSEVLRLLPKSAANGSPLIAKFRVTDADAEAWLSTLGERTPTAAVGLDALAWCQALPLSCGDLTHDNWFGVLESLVDLAGVQSVQLQDANPNVWAEQLFSVELPVALAWQFPEINRCAVLADKAAKVLSASILNLSDGMGMIHGNYLDAIGPLTASWTRSLAMLKEVPGIKVSKDAFEEYDWTIRNLLRLSRADGQLSLSPVVDAPPRKQGDESTDLARVVASALRLTEDDEDLAIAKLRLAGKNVSISRLPSETSIHSEWSGISVLQSSWRPEAPRLMVDHSNSAIRLELEVASTVLFSTVWQPDILVDGKRLEAVEGYEAPWEAVCWFDDVDADYLELELELSGEWKLQRQLLLGKSEDFLMVCDNLVASDPAGPADIDYRLTVPLANGVSVRSQGETREGLITTGKRNGELAMVLPLALPEWINATGEGELHLRDGAIQLHQRTKGRALSTPLFFDLDPDRMRSPRTWRHLTVAEKRRIVLRDEAVCYRIQVGSSQWLMYRSLTPDGNGNRTFVGQNVSSEFLFAQLDMDGATETIIEIE